MEEDADLPEEEELVEAVLLQRGEVLGGVAAGFGCAAGELLLRLRDVGGGRDGLVLAAADRVEEAVPGAGVAPVERRVLLGGDRHVEVEGEPRDGQPEHGEELAPAVVFAAAAVDDERGEQGGQEAENQEDLDGQRLLERLALGILAVEHQEEHQEAAEEAQRGPHGRAVVAAEEVGGDPARDDQAERPDHQRAHGLELGELRRVGQQVAARQRGQQGEGVSGELAIVVAQRQQQEGRDEHEALVVGQAE